MQTLNDVEMDGVAGGMLPLAALLVWEVANVGNIRDFADGIVDRFLHERYPSWW